MLCSLIIDVRVVPISTLQRHLIDCLCVVWCVCVCRETSCAQEVADSWSGEDICNSWCLPRGMAPTPLDLGPVTPSTRHSHHDVSDTPPTKHATATMTCRTQHLQGARQTRHSHHDMSHTPPTKHATATMTCRTHHLQGARQTRHNHHDMSHTAPTKHTTAIMTCRTHRAPAKHATTTMTCHTQHLQGAHQTRHSHHDLSHTAPTGRTPQPP